MFYLWIKHSFSGFIQTVQSFMLSVWFQLMVFISITVRYIMEAPLFGALKFIDKRSKNPTFRKYVYNMLNKYTDKDVCSYQEKFVCNAKQVNDEIEYDLSNSYSPPCQKKILQENRRDKNSIMYIVRITYRIY